MVMVHVMVTLLHGGYTCFMIGFMLCSSDYSVLDIVSAKLLSMICMYLGFGMSCHPQGCLAAEKAKEKERK